jgi:hypothetical protein
MRDITTLAPGSQPAPSMVIPISLLRALDTFMIGATFKRAREPGQHCAFLCHVSTRTSDHAHIVDLLRKYKTDLAESLKKRNTTAIARLRVAFDDLASTHAQLALESFDELLKSIEFFSPGITVKLVNGETDEDVALTSPYNLFVGGNKLGRGVTIRNLLVSYYGRNPRKPQADTVLQHARMYGYRRKDIGLLRLFLPGELHVVFRAINKMERSLRELIARKSPEEFRGIYLESGLNATRKNIIAPGSVGVYSAGSNYNPAQILRDASVAANTAAIDARVMAIRDKKYAEISIEDMQTIISLTVPDPAGSERIWDPGAVAGSLGQFAKLRNCRAGYVYVDRDRDLNEARRETQGILTGGEMRTVPEGLITLFLLRTPEGNGRRAAWWPQIRFPDGQYAFAFAV